MIFAFKHRPQLWKKNPEKLITSEKQIPKPFVRNAASFFGENFWKSIRIQKNNNENNGVKLNYAIFSPSRQFINLLNCRRIKFDFFSF